MKHVVLDPKTVNASSFEASSYTNKIPPINEKNLERFVEVYDMALKEARKKYPDDYAWHPSEHSIVVSRMRTALRNNSYNNDGHAFKVTCKKLALKHTRKAVEAFLRERP